MPSRWPRCWPTTNRRCHPARGRGCPLRSGSRNSEASARPRTPVFPRTESDRALTMPATWTISGVQEALASKKISARELAADYYKRIEARNAELNAYLTLSQDRAFAHAERVDALVAAGKPLPPLAGVPIAAQDAISTRGVRTTCGSEIPENYITPYDPPPVPPL